VNKQLIKKIATESVKEAGQLLMENVDKIKKRSFKAKSDIVTEIDVAAEKMIIKKIKKHFPKHGILAEESGAKVKKSKYLWIIDPIDGTMNYYHSSAPFRVALVFLENNKPLISAIYNPVKDELYYAEKGKGATMNDKKITVNKNSKLEYSIVMTHVSSKKAARARTILALDSVFKSALHMRMFGSGISAMCYIASGKFDVFFNVHTYPWDILPGALLIQEAGGKVTDIEGNKITAKSTAVLATNGKVHDQMLKLLKDV